MFDRLMQDRQLFISHQYGWVSEVSGEYFDAMLIFGFDCYVESGFSVSSLRDIDLMLMGL